MKGITKIINEYIREKNPNVDAFSTIFNDMFPDDNSLYVISRHDPSEARETAFIDGTFEGLMNIAYYVRSSNSQEARELLNIIMNCIDDITIDTDGVSIDIEADTLPSFVGTDDKENSIYTSSIKVKYIR